MKETNHIAQQKNCYYYFGSIINLNPIFIVLAIYLKALN